MAVLNQQYLQMLGIDLDEQTYQAFSQHFEETLSERVINEIVANLDELQAGELATMQDKSEDELQAWLQANVPDLKEIVEDEVYILMDELVENAGSI